MSSSDNGGRDRSVKQMDLDETRRRVASKFGDEFLFDEERTGESGVPAFLHPLSGHCFRYLTGGEFLMGLSPQEEKAARALCDPPPLNLEEMRPVTRVTVRPMLVAEQPVRTRQLPGEGKAAYPDSAAYVGYDDALEHCTRFGMDLPSEAEWEYFCRANSTTLFTWGDDLPTEKDLAEWLTFDFKAGLGRVNRFGIHGLYVGEWCSTLFTPAYDEPPVAGSQARVIRGGGAFFWPWQDEEWAFCMSAMRMPSTDLPDDQCGFRFVRRS